MSILQAEMRLDLWCVLVVCFVLTRARTLEKRDEDKKNIDADVDGKHCMCYILCSYAMY